MSSESRANELSVPGPRFWNEPVWICVGHLAILGLSAGGCASQPVLGTVSGTVVCPDNRPLEGLLVTYLPDPSRETMGRQASGVTDEAGRYELTYRGTPDRSGTVVGWHKVVIEDYAVENSRQRRRSANLRVPAKYRLASTTPLEVQIHSGPQTVDLHIEK